MRTIALALSLLGLRPAQARRPDERYDFLPAPQINLSLLYRLDTLTGEVVACQFAHNPGKPTSAPAPSGSPRAIAAATGPLTSRRAIMC